MSEFDAGQEQTTNSDSGGSVAARHRRRAHARNARAGRERKHETKWQELLDRPYPGLWSVGVLYKLTAWLSAIWLVAEGLLMLAGSSWGYFGAVGASQGFGVVLLLLAPLAYLVNIAGYELCHIAVELGRAQDRRNVETPQE